MDDLRIMTSLHLSRNVGTDAVAMMRVANIAEVKDTVMITMAMLDDNRTCLIAMAQEGVGGAIHSLRLGRATHYQVVGPGMHSIEIVGTILRFCMAGKKDTSLQVRAYT